MSTELQDRKGFAEQEINLSSRLGPHYGEEVPSLEDTAQEQYSSGSCNLGCIFCQNYTMSHFGEGEEIPFEKTCVNNA